MRPWTDCDAKQPLIPVWAYLRVFWRRIALVLEHMGGVRARGQPEWAPSREMSIHGGRPVDVAWVMCKTRAQRLAMQRCLWVWWSGDTVRAARTYVSASYSRELLLGQAVNPYSMAAPPAHAAHAPRAAHVPLVGHEQPADNRPLPRRVRAAPVIRAPAAVQQVVRRPRQRPVADRAAPVAPPPHGRGPAQAAAAAAALARAAPPLPAVLPEQIAAEPQPLPEAAPAIWVPPAGPRPPGLPLRPFAAPRGVAVRHPPPPAPAAARPRRAHAWGRPPPPPPRPPGERRRARRRPPVFERLPGIVFGIEPAAPVLVDPPAEADPGRAPMEVDLPLPVLGGAPLLDVVPGAPRPAARPGRVPMDVDLRPAPPVEPVAAPPAPRAAVVFVPPPVGALAAPRVVWRLSPPPAVGPPVGPDLHFPRRAAAAAAIARYAAAARPPVHHRLPADVPLAVPRPDPAPMDAGAPPADVDAPPPAAERAPVYVPPSVAEMHAVDRVREQQLEHDRDVGIIFRKLGVLRATPFSGVRKAVECRPLLSPSLLPEG